MLVAAQYTDALLGHEGGRWVMKSFWALLGSLEKFSCLQGEPIWLILAYPMQNNIPEFSTIHILSPKTDSSMHFDILSLWGDLYVPLK